MTGGGLFETTVEAKCHVAHHPVLCCDFWRATDFTVADDVAMIAPIIVSIANRSGSTVFQARMRMKSRTMRSETSCN